jgi:PAS domain-containing protein
MSMSLDGVLTYASPRATAVMDDPQNLLGVYYPDLVLPDDHDALAAAIENLATGATEASQVCRLRRPDGQLLGTETSFRPVIVDAVLVFASEIAYASWRLLHGFPFGLAATTDVEKPCIWAGDAVRILFQVYAFNLIYVPP